MSKASKAADPKVWAVELHDDFDAEFDALTSDVQDNLLAAAKAVENMGPEAGRPYVDTLKNSKHANMKELRFEGNNGNEEWRAAFAFDIESHAIILCAADKQGVKKEAFYKALIAKADKRFTAHQDQLKKKKAQQEKDRKQAARASQGKAPKSGAKKSRGK